MITSQSSKTMPILLKNNNDSSVSSSAPSESQLFSCSSWENSTDSHPQRSSMSKPLSLKMGVSTKHCHNTEQLCFQFQDQDSSSTQSTGQSDSEAISIKSNSLYTQGLVCAHSGYSETSGKSNGGQIKQVSSMGTQDFAFTSQLDCVQPLGHVPFHFAEPYFGGLLATATYGQRQIHHPQLVGMAPSRVPLPLDHLTEDEPIYVNAKQYRAIMRRRQSRAKLQAQNKLVKARKPYLHESRHRHAMKRARGSGGRFLTAKDVQASKEGSSSSTQLRSAIVHNMENGVQHLENNHKADGSLITSCSEVTSGTHGDDDHIFQHQEFRFVAEVYPISMHSHVVGSHGVGSHQHGVSTLG